MTKELEDLRSEIDKIDAKIVELLNKRADIAKKIGEIKNSKIYKLGTYKGKKKLYQTY